MKAGIQAIISKINEDAEQHGNECYTRIKNKVDEEIRNENRIHIAEMAKRGDILKKHHEHEYSLILERMKSRLNNEIMLYKRNLINEIFDTAALKLRECSEKKFLDMFKSVIKDLSGSFDLYFGEFSKDRIGANKIKETIKENKNADIVLSDEIIKNKSGFVLRDDRVEYNCLFEDLIEDKKNEQMASIMREVFGDGE